MSASAAMLALVASPLLATTEPGWLDSFFGKTDEFRMQWTNRESAPKPWPFAVTDGILMCANVAGEPTVYFSEVPPDDDSDPRVVIVSEGWFDLAVLNIGSKDLFAPYESARHLADQLKPHVEKGLALCKLPEGTIIMLDGSTDMLEDGTP